MVRSSAAKPSAQAQNTRKSAAKSGGKAKAEAVAGPNQATGEIFCRRCSEMLGEDSYHRPPECALEAKSSPAGPPAGIEPGKRNELRECTAGSLSPAGTSTGGGDDYQFDPNDPLLQPGAIADPLTGEIYTPDDPDYTDRIIDCLARVNEVLERCTFAKNLIREALGRRREGDLKTCRVAGKRRKVVLTFPSESFEQSILKEAWHSYPQFRDEVLKIDSIGVKLREWKKAAGTSGEADYNTFRDMVARASRGEVGLPTVKIEL